MNENKELFKGLYIEDKIDWEDKYPVIYLKFDGDLRSSANIKNVILDLLKENQKRLDIKCEKIEKYDSCFRELIQDTYKKYNKKVVILIDEYDSNINNKKLGLYNGLITGNICDYAFREIEK